MIEIIDGFDTNIDSSLNWNSGSAYGANGGRFGGSSATGVYPATYTTFQKTLSNQSSRYCGFALLKNSYYPYDIVSFIEGTTPQITLSTGSQGQLQFYSGSTILAQTQPFFLRTNAWYYLEVFVNISLTGGSFILRIGEQTILQVINANTQQSSNAYTNIIQFTVANAINGNQQSIDDLYVLNNVGTKNNTFLGEQKVITSNVNSDYSVQFLRNSGITNYGQLLTDDSDVSYNSSNNIGDKDLFGIVPLTLTPNNFGEFYTGNNITATRMVVVARKNDVGFRNIGLVMDSGPTENVFPFSVSSAGNSVFFIPLLPTYESSSTIFENDPNTNASWTKTAVNAVHIGYKLIG